MLRFRDRRAQAIGSAKVFNVFAVVAHGVLSREVEVFADPFKPEDFAILVKSVDRIGNGVEGVLRQDIPSDEIAKIKICFKSTDHVRRNMALNGVKINLQGILDISI